jgi:hypothetical protein
VCLRGITLVDHFLHQMCVLCVSINLFGTKDRKLWHSSQSHMSPIIKDGCQDSKRKGWKHEAYSRKSQTRDVLL